MTYFGHRSVFSPSPFHVFDEKWGTLQQHRRYLTCLSVAFPGVFCCNYKLLSCCNVFQPRFSWLCYVLDSCTLVTKLSKIRQVDTLQLFLDSSALSAPYDNERDVYTRKWGDQSMFIDLRTFDRDYFLDLPDRWKRSLCQNNSKVATWEYAQYAGLLHFNCVSGEPVWEKIPSTYRNTAGCIQDYDLRCDERSVGCRTISEAPMPPQVNT